MKIKRIMIKTLFWIWGFPQNLIGLFLFLFWKVTKKITLKQNYLDTKVYTIKGSVFKGGVSLGMYVFLFGEYESDFKSFIVKHEYGHSRQSKILGPLYMFIIAIPSMIWNACFEGYRRKRQVSYYWFYTESWANKLMGIQKVK